MKIRAKREAMGWTQKELAERMDVTVMAVSYWETGRNIPTPDKLRKLAKIFDCSMEELLG